MKLKQWLELNNSFNVTMRVLVSLERIPAIGVWAKKLANRKGPIGWEDVF